MTGTTIPGTVAPKTQKAILAAASIGFFILTLDTTVVSVALPTIGRALHASISDLQWISDGYLLFLAGLLLSAGKCADAFGARRVFVLALGGFGVMSIACALSTSSLMLEIARALQGVAGAFILPASLSMIRQTVADGRERARAVAVWAGSGGVAVAIGPVLGGLLTQGLGWQAIFILNIPVCVVAFLLVWLRRGAETAPQSQLRRLDMPGQLLSFLAIASVTFGLIQGNEIGWHHPWVVAGFAAAAVFFAAFLYHEARTAAPAIPLGLFRQPLFSTVNVTGFTQNFSVYGLLFILSLLFQQVLHHSPVVAGLLFLPMTGSVTVSNLLAGKLARRYGQRLPLLTGIVVLIFGLLLCLLITERSSIPMLLALLLPIGWGAGMIVPPITSLALEAVDQSMAGVASGVLSVSRQFGSIAGIAVYGALTAAASTFISGFHTSIVACLLAMGLTLVLCVLFVRPPMALSETEKV